MQNPLFKRDETPNYDNPAIQKEFVEAIQTNRELLQKELSVNRAEQKLLEKRLILAKSLINDLPSSDPEYGILVAQVQMDQIETDELKIRELSLIRAISDLDE